MLQIERQYVHVTQSSYDPRGSMRLLVSQSFRDPDYPGVHNIRVLRRVDEEFKWVEASLFAQDDSSDGIILSPEDAQRIVDQLWVYGHRPSEAVGSAGALTACKDHLADMRSVVTHFLDDNPLAAPLAAANVMNDRISQYAVASTLAEATAMITARENEQILAEIREVNSFVRERANAEAAHWRELGERFNGIEADLEGDGDSRRSIPEQISVMEGQVLERLNAIAGQLNRRDPLTLDEAFDDPESVVYQALVAKGWTPPQ